MKTFVVLPTPRLIIFVFLQDESKKALLFIRSVKPAMSRPADVELHLSVLIQNGLVTEAFFFQVNCFMIYLFVVFHVEQQCKFIVL